MRSGAWAMLSIGLLACLSSLAAAAGERPNFIILMTDDQRADAMGCAGNKILAGKTPNMDRIAAQGIRFTNMFVTNSLCAPSRATLLTGMYSHTHGVKDNKNPRLQGSQMILSDLLRNGGYEVAFCGKSHLAGALRDRTWDYYFGYEGQGSYLDPKIAEGVKGETQVHEGYIDDIVTDKAVAYLNKKRDKPFCLFLWFKAPHRSWLRARRHHDLFREAVIPKPPTYDDDLKKYPGKPRAFVNADNKIGRHNDVRSLEFIKDYYATLVAVDENVGKVLAAVTKTGQLDNTVILFTSDNGFFHGEFGLFDKRLMHEPSIRVPLLLRYPKVIKAGSVCAEMVLNIDIAPTILELAGQPVPKWMHGKSLVPLLKDPRLEDKDAKKWRADFLYEYFEFPGPHSVRKHRGIRSRTKDGKGQIHEYKLIHYYDDPQEFELYDLTADPLETKNLYHDKMYVKLVNHLQTRLDILRKETGDE